MHRANQTRYLVALAIFATGIFTGMAFGGANVATAQSSDRVFELRTYTTHPGRLEALHTRFADHTIRLFERHGMTNVGYFTPQDSPLADNTLIYVLAHDSRTAAEASWKAFIADPEWQAAYRESISDQPIIESLESVFMDPTEYSQIR
jgi:ureidoglycolate hydrolase